MAVETIVSVAVSVTVVVVSVGVAWGKLGRGQSELRSKLIDVQQQIEARLTELITELRNIPNIYVRSDVDDQRNKLIDERDIAIRSILNDIKEELKHIRRGSSDVTRHSS